LGSEDLTGGNGTEGRMKNRGICGIRGRRDGRGEEKKEDRKIEDKKMEKSERER
jgi:hypothetical protein